VFRFGDFCVDTEADPDVISLSSTGQAVNLHLGLTPDLVANRKYTGRLTVYLTGEDNGIAWEDYIVQTETWPVCPAS
jgi:hypothetical protein